MAGRGTRSRQGILARTFEGREVVLDVLGKGRRLTMHDGRAVAIEGAEQGELAVAARTAGPIEVDRFGLAAHLLAALLAAVTVLVVDVVRVAGRHLGEEGGGG